MKQRLNKENILSLTDEQKEKLRELWEPKRHDTILFEFEEETIVGLTLGKDILISEWDYETEEPIEIDKKDCLPLLSIGQMIEILTKHTNYDLNYEQLLEVLIHESTEKTMCDTLFQALKEVL